MTWSTSLRSNYWGPRELNKILNIGTHRADLKRRGRKGVWQRKSSGTRSSEQPSSPVKHIQKYMGTSTQRDEPSSGQAHIYQFSAKSRIFCYIFKSAVYQQHSSKTWTPCHHSADAFRVFFPLHNSAALCVLPSAFLLLLCKHFINHSPRLLLSHTRHLFQPASPENQARWTLIRRRQDSTTGWQRQKHCSVIKLVNCWSPHGAQMELTEPPGWTTIYQCYVLYPFSRLNWPLLSLALFICFTTGYLHRLTFKFKNRQPKKRSPLFRRGEKTPIP